MAPSKHRRTQRERREAIWPYALASALFLTLALSLLFSARASAVGGGLQAWGYNGAGQLGNGTTNNGLVPANVTGLPTGVVGVAAGAEHSLALLSDGTVMAWGDNFVGQLGIGSNTGPDNCAGTPCSATPLPVGIGSGVVAIAAGDRHSLALLSNGTVMAWGENRYGQLGDGTTNERTAPVPVSGLTGVLAIAAGGFHSLALLSNGTVMAWGQNSDGELGIGNNTGPETCGSSACSTLPVPVPGLSGVMSIAGGFTDGHSLALLSNGAVMAWGQNDNGELGTGSKVGPETCGAFSCSTRPVPVTGLPGAISITAGAATSLARLPSGAAMDWGWGLNGGLGNGASADSATPVGLPGLSGVVALAGGDTDAVALLSGGTAEAWGSNSNGRLGVGSELGPEDCSGTPCSRTPVPVQGFAGGTAIAAGFGHVLGLVGPSQRLGVSLAGAGSGVVGAPGVLCPPSCAQPYPQGMPLSLLAQASPGSGFAGFSGACTGTGPCRLAMSQDQSVEATFGPPKGTRITRAKVRRRSHTATFSFTAPGAITGFQCQLVRPRRKHHRRRKARFRPCVTPRRYRHLKAGRYTFRVRALDILGADPAPARRKFKFRR
jgi:alpha-tubulin suppressor-like RCC1 family protein